MKIVLRDEMRREQQDVLATLTERRKGQRKHAQAIVQIRPELAGVDHLVQAGVGRRHEPRTHPLLGRGADRAKDPLLQDAQEHHLGSRREHLGLIQEYRAAARMGDEALSPRVRIRVRPSLVAEELALQQRVDERAAIDRDER